MICDCEYDAYGTYRCPSIDKYEDVSSLFKNIGDSCCLNTSSKNSPGLSVCKFTPQKTLTLKEHMATTDIYMMSFCLGESMEWSLAEVAGKQLTIERNESCIMTGGTEQCVSTYEKGRQYHGIGIAFDPLRLQGVTECLQCENAINSHGSIAGGLKRYIVTPHVGVILSQIIDCDVCGRLKDLYLEAKLLELIAVYLDEMVCQRRDDMSELSLSKDDLFALNRAKEILDKTFVHPLTLSELSQKVYLNEYKLKTGFKQCFGQTVYGYVLEKRMELARLLIEQRRFKISDIAGMVGYVSTSHFITAFSKKYGVTPGEFTKANIARE